MLRRKDSTNPFDNANDGSNVSQESHQEDNHDLGTSPSTTSSASALFPDWLSSWMAISPLYRNPPEEEEDDEDESSLYHDCLESSSSIEDETTSLLPRTRTAQHDDVTTSDSLSPLRQRAKFYNATSTSDRKSPKGLKIDTSLQGQIHPPRDAIGSPYSEALATWLSPYANSAKRAGRKILHFPGEAEETKSNATIRRQDGENEDIEACADEKTTKLVGKSNDGGQANNGEEATKRTGVVRFHPDYRDREKNNNEQRKMSPSFLSRVSSSPALMTTLSDEKWQGEEESARMHSRSSDYSSIVLRDIVVQGDNSNESENDGTDIHPWTKLILLEELGTAWSWFVLLLPYVFMALAVFLDGNTTLKNNTVGPLLGNRTCADIWNGSVPTPFDVSVKGYYPVPFRLVDVYQSEPREVTPGSCTYPFELREGVGILSNGKNAYSNVTSTSNASMPSEMISIVDLRYRYLMSHGHAFTSGVISNVPPTSQSLRGSVKFNDLSSRAVALVARGSVLVSAIVFQRPTSIKNDEGSNTTSVKQWSPVLILGSKKLDMVCKLNAKYTEGKDVAPTWNCSSRQIINAFFSLPNTAVLMGGDLRVDILLSHHKTYKSLTEDLWFNERGGTDDDYIIHDFNQNLDLSKADKLLSSADVSKPQQLLAELSKKSAYKFEHESIAFNHIVEAVRIFALAVTLIFTCYWWWSMEIMDGCSDCGSINEDDTPTMRQVIWTYACKLIHVLSRGCGKSTPLNRFWWEDPWLTFPERRYLLLLLLCLVMLQNPLLVYAFFHPSLYSSAKFRFAADSISGISVHGILFLWLCLVHGLRYHTADIARRRLDQHRRVLELRKATRHISPTNEIEDNQWGRVRWYYQQYGDIDGGYSLALRLKHGINSDSFAEFIFPKITLLIIGTIASVTAAAARFPMSDNTVSERAELNPDRFGSGSKVYAISSIVQIIIIQVWCLFILYTSFVTGERLRREPFLSTRPAQLAFRVLSSILLLGAGFSISLFFIRSLNLVGNKEAAMSDGVSGNDISYDTSHGSGESWDSKADILFEIIRRASTEIPYVGTASNIGPGKILYATACSLVVAYIFLPSSHFHPSNEEQRMVEEIAMGPDQCSKQTMLSVMDKRFQGKDKRFVVALARSTHTWRVFPLPSRRHGLMSQHTLKETLNILGTFQIDGHFNMHKFKFGRGSIYKGKYNPVFCVEIACWLLEASWQAYYSPSEYSLNEWAPGRMRLDSIGLKLEHAIDDSETDTHAFVASNVSAQVEGEEDSIIVVAFRGSASISNIKTDLSFRQVPLPEKMISDVPAFNIRPRMPIAVDETLWDKMEPSSPSIIPDLLGQPPGKYTSWPTTAAEHTNVDATELNPSLLIPAVSSGAKAIIRATPMARQALPCVHEGFVESYSKIRHEVIEAIVSVLKRQLDKAVERSWHEQNSSSEDAPPLTLPKIYITGHSMGGAIGQLLALDLASNCEIVIDQPLPRGKGPSNINERGFLTKQSTSSLNHDGGEAQGSPDNSDIYWLGRKLTHHSIPMKKIRLCPPIAVYTYGQSRLGNKAFKAIYKKRVPHTFRVVTEGDAITSMPTVGPFFGGIYRHAGLEVLLEEGCTGNILVGPTVVETLLRFTKVRTSMAAHSLDRYRESLESALGREDLKEYYRGHGGKVRHNDQGVYSGNGAPLPSWVTSVKRSTD